jgi:hypothetical protein
VRHLGLERLGIDLQSPARIRLDPADRQIQSVGRAGPAGRIEHSFRPHPAAIAQMADGPALLVDLDALDLDAEPELDAALAQVVDEFLDDLAIDEIEKLLTRLDHRHRHVHRGKDRGVFDADHPGTDHRQAARHMRLGGDVVAVEDAGVVEGNIRRPMRRSADGDDDVLAFERMFLGAVSVARADRQRVRVDEARHPGKRLDAVARELVLQHLDLVVEGLGEPCAEVLALDVLFDAIGEAVEPALPPARQVQHRFTQRL